MKLPIHIMFQPDHLSAREMALEDVDVYVEEPSFLQALCAETGAVPRAAPMNVRAPAPPRQRAPGRWTRRDARRVPPGAARCRLFWHGGRSLAAPHRARACSRKCVAALGL